MKNTWLSFTIPDKLRTNLSLICQTIASKTPNFKPMSYEMIHMTAVFIGKVQIKEDDVLQIVSRHNLHGNFQFDRLEYFPPNSSKSNLIVAIFQADNHDEIVDTLKRMKEQINDELGCNISVNDEIESNDFVPHFTLGKLVKLNESDLNELGMNESQFLSDIDNEIVNRSKLRFSIEKDNPLHLCGGSWS